MAVPVRSSTQRDQALAAALHARQERARLRDDLHARRVTGVDVVTGAPGNAVWAGLRVRWLLEALPGIGPVRAARLMEEIGIAPTRRIQGLGVRQRDALVATLRRSSR